MPDGSRGGIELLVHAAAPSRGQDDAQYRAFAEAYVAFEPQTRHSLQQDEEQSSNADRDAESQLQDELLQSSFTEIADRQETNQLSNDNGDDCYSLSEAQTQSPLPRAYFTRSVFAKAATQESPKASSKNVWDNTDSPVFRGLGSSSSDLSEGRPAGPTLIADEASWHTPQSIVADSQSPYNRAIPEFSSPTRILELYLQQFDNSNLESTFLQLNGQANSAHCSSSVAPATSAPKENSTLTTDRSSRIPVSSAKSAALTPPTTRIQERLFEQPQGSLQPVIPSHNARPATANSPLHGTAASEASFSHMRSQSEPLHRRAHHLASSLSSQNRLQDLNSRILTNPTSTRKRNDSPVPLSLSLSASLLSSSAEENSSQSLPRFPPPKKPRSARHGANEIHPPLPPTSVLPLPSSLTPALISLAAGLSLSERYQPTLQTRPLRQLERGYWLTAVSSWPAAVRGRAWEFLQGYIGKGNAGWGVWCCRSSADGWADLQRKEGCDEADGEEWRIYCWGEVVGHVYLLLYLASERWIKGAGAKWVDGGGEVVVGMPVGRVRTL